MEIFCGMNYLCFINLNRGTCTCCQFFKILCFVFLNKSKGDFKDFLAKLGFTYKSMNTSIFHLTIFCKMSLIVFYFMKYSEELKFLTLLASEYFTLCSDELFCF